MSVIGHLRTNSQSLPSIRNGNTLMNSNNSTQTVTRQRSQKTRPYKMTQLPKTHPQKSRKPRIRRINMNRRSQTRIPQIDAAVTQQRRILFDTCKNKSSSPPFTDRVLLKTRDPCQRTSLLKTTQIAGLPPQAA
jgi:hypothetical protein